MFVIPPSARALAFVVVGISAGMVGSVATAAPASRVTHAAALAATIHVGDRIRPTLHLKAGAAAQRTVEQANAYQAAHPALGLHQIGQRPLITMDMKAYRLAKQLAAQAARTEKPGAGLGAPPPAAPTHLYSKTAGPAETDTGNSAYPPDPSVAIGGNYIVVVVNNTYNVYDRHRNLLLAQTFNAKYGTADQLVGARVLYDSVWRRWIVYAVDNTGGSSYIWISISKNANPEGPIWLYASGFPVPAGDKLDYPMVGMSENNLFFTQNHFSGGSYVNSLSYAISKDRLYNGLPFGAGILATGGGTMAPPIVEDTSPKAYFLVADGGTALDLWEGTDLATNAATFTLKAQLPLTYAVPPDAPQYNTSEVLDTLDARFEGPSYQYLDGTLGDIVLWNTHTRALGSFAGPYLYEIDASNASPSILQQSAFFATLTSNDFNASVAVNTTGEGFLTWNSTDVPNHLNVNIRYWGFQPGDTLGNVGGNTLIPNSLAMLHNQQSPGIQSWGSHAGIALDPLGRGACNANERAVIVNETTVSHAAWGTEFGVIGYC